MKKRLLSLFLALVMILGMIPVTGAEEITVVDSGSCGEDMTWTLTSDGLLTISGTGEMEYEDGARRPPWMYLYGDQITSIVVEEGVVTVGPVAFAHLLNLVSVSLPSTLEDFDTGDTFYQTLNQKTITVAEGNQTFCTVNGVLYSKDMRYLWKVPTAMTCDFVVPESVIWLYAFVFESCTKLDSVTFTGNAPGIFYRAFEDAVVDCFYPADNPTWTKNLLQNYRGTLTWNGEPGADMHCPGGFAG